jgi:hypothetical protein
MSNLHKAAKDALNAIISNTDSPAEATVVLVSLIASFIVVHTDNRADAKALTEKLHELIIESVEQGDVTLERNLS